MPLLQQIDLTIAKGEQVAIIGPSGAGKTMLLQTMAACQQAQEGQIRLFGQDPWALSSTARQRLRAELFFAPQTPPLPPRQRVITSVLAGRLPHWSVWQALRSLIKPIEAEAAWRALQEFDLQDKLYARVDRLSGGERQRCALARMLLSSARLLLVDEPLSALDPSLAQKTLHSLQQQAQQRGASLVCSLHQVELAQRFFPRLIGVAQGKIIFDCATSEVTPSMLSELYAKQEAISKLAEQQPAQPELAHAPHC